MSGGSFSLSLHSFLPSLALHARTRWPLAHTLAHARRINRRRLHTLHRSCSSMRSVCVQTSVCVARMMRCFQNFDAVAPNDCDRLMAVNECALVCEWCVCAYDACSPCSFAMRRDETIDIGQRQMTTTFGGVSGVKQCLFSK